MIVSTQNKTQVKNHIKEHIGSQPESKQQDMQALHAQILKIDPKCTLWFDDGVNEQGKVVCNPTIGYGTQTLVYANGTTREFFRIGFSANTTGISLYVMGLDDKTYLTKTFGPSIGKASVTGYCVKFKKLADLDVETLTALIKYGLTRD